VRQILGRTVRCGGESHSGWLPKGAATPPQTPSRLVRLDFSIVQDGESSYLLQWVGPEPERTSNSFQLKHPWLDFISSRACRRSLPCGRLLRRVLQLNSRSVRPLVH
jgi:hypothetical protein